MLITSYDPLLMTFMKLYNEKQMPLFFLFYCLVFSFDTHSVPLS